MVNSKLISEFIRENRKRLGFTQKQLAEIIGVSDSTVSLWESKDTAITDEICEKLARVFNITVCELKSANLRVNPIMRHHYKVFSIWVLLYNIITSLMLMITMMFKTLINYKLNFIYQDGQMVSKITQNLVSIFKFQVNELNKDSLFIIFILNIILLALIIIKLIYNKISIGVIYFINILIMILMCMVYKHYTDIYFIIFLFYAFAGSFNFMYILMKFILIRNEKKKFGL